MSKEFLNKEAIVKEFLEDMRDGCFMNMREYGVAIKEIEGEVRIVKSIDVILSRMS